MKGLRRRDSSVISMLAIQPEDLSLIFNTHVESQVWIVTQHWKEREGHVRSLAYEPASTVRPLAHAAYRCLHTGVQTSIRALKMDQVQEWR